LTTLLFKKEIKLIYATSNLKNSKNGNYMIKLSTVLNIVFHRTVFAAILLLYIVTIIIDYIVDIIPTPWGMYLFIPIAIFGLLGYLIDEIR
jgi:hypothetical protein